MSGLDVDTRSDIYSLGVLLYELLTGTTPFDRERLKTAAYDEIRRIIADEEPPKPSTRMSTPGIVRSTAFRRDYQLTTSRRSDSQELSRLLRGELDWIVMKCLEKDRNRRYATANGLAADVERYLHDEPVQACPPSTWYRLRKSVRRNRVPFIAASAVALLMLLSIVSLVVSNVRVRHEQARTSAEMHRAEQAETLALRRAGEIQQGLEKLKAANELVNTARFYTDERRWDDASAAFTSAIELRPEHAPAWEGRGVLYASLGLWDLAASDLAHAAKLEEPVTANRWLLLALTQAYVGDLAGYRDACRRMNVRLQGTTVHRLTIDLIRANTLVPDSTDDPTRLVNVAEAIVATKPPIPWYLHALGAVHHRAGQDELAIKWLHESIEVDPNWTGRAIGYPFLAMAYHRLDRPEEAKRWLTEAEQAIEQWIQARYGSSGLDNWVASQGATVSWPVFWWDVMACQLVCGEARNVMGLAPRSQDFRQRVLRARAFAGLRWLDKALGEYEEVLKERPNDQQILLETHRTRAFLHASRRQWHQAAAEYARTSDLQPNEPYFWWYQAVLHQAAADQESYRRICLAILERFGTATEPRTAHSVVSACTLLPDALPDMGRLIPLGEVAARWYPGSGRMLAAAQCRAGEYREAVRNYEEAAIHYRLRADDWLLLALAHHHLGEDEQAQHCYLTATQWIEEANGRQLGDPASTLPAWGDWHEPICVQLLRQEAESVLNK
jgi:tetratricopeptide (TPR) repeat protein